MNQRTEEDRKPYVARFVPCPNCGLHGEIIIDGVPESADYPVPLAHQGQVRSQEAAILQATSLLTDSYINASGFRDLLRQILETGLAPTEKTIKEWGLHMMLMQASEGSGPLSALMAALNGMPRASRPASSRG